MSTDLTIREDQTFWDNRQLAALQQLGVDRATSADLAVFFHQAVRTGLDPFARQIYMIERQGRQTIQTGIDGFRLIARRATDAARGTLGYEDTQWCGEDGQWRDVWLSKEPPAAARATVIRDGQRYPAIALWTEYVATKRNGEITQMWATKPALMLAKCAEALALRKAFPQDLSGLYTSDEMGQADNRRPEQPAQRRTLAAAVAEHAPTVDVPDAEEVEATVDPDPMTDSQRAVLNELWREVPADVRTEILAGRDPKRLTREEADEILVAFSDAADTPALDVEVES